MVTETSGVCKGIFPGPPNRGKTLEHTPSYLDKRVANKVPIGTQFRIFNLHIVLFSILIPRRTAPGGVITQHSDKICLSSLVADHQ